MKNKNILALALLCGFSFSQVSFADSETVIYNKEGITVNLIADGEGTFKISVENKSSKDMVGVKVKTEDIKGLKIVKGKELEIGDVKVGEKKVLENEKIQFEVVEAIKDGIKKGKLSKTGIAGVYKINVTIAVAGIVGVICVLVSKKRNAKKLLSVAVGTGILMSSVLAYNSSADGVYKNSADLAGKIEIKGKTYDYVGILMWNDANSNGDENNPDNNNPDNNNPDDNKPDEEEQDKVVEFEDENLKKFILDKLHAYEGEDSFEAEMNEYNFKLTDKSYRKDKNSNEIYKSDLEKIESIGIRGMDAAEENLIEVSSIKGLEYCKNLKTLTISSGEIPDDNEEIRYSKGAIKDLTPLSNLKKLELLRLSHNEISDVSPLKDLKRLKYLYISHNNISDISSLKDLTNLENFDFAVNKISEMSVVKNFKKLNLLDIYSNKISDISYVKELENITYLRADNNNIENISALKNLKLLENLDLGNNKIKDISVIDGLTKLTKLSLKGNNLDSFNLTNITKVEDLNLENNKISDVTFLEKLTKLTSLNLNKNNVENIDAVSNLKDLIYLYMNNNKVSNIEALKSLNKLSNLTISNNNVSDISALKDLNELASVKIDGNKVRDFSPINDKSSIFEKVIHNQNLDLDDVAVSEKIFEIENPFIGLDKITKGGNVNVSSETEGVTVTLEDGKLKFNLTDEALNKIKDGGLDLKVKFAFENEMDYANNPTELNLNLKLVHSSKKVVKIEDAKLLKVINKNLDKNRADNQEVTVEEMESLTELSIFLKEDGSADFSENAKYSILGVPQSLAGTKDFKFAVTRGMKSIKGLEYAKNLRKLKVNENEIADITPLKNLTKLEYLEIQRNRIVDLKPLEKLTNLTFLKLYNNLIEDITPLSNLTNLTGLDLHYNVTVEGDELHKNISKGITDISALKNLKKLTFLDISANRIEDVSIIKDLNKIEHLDISGNRVKNYEGLGDYIAERLEKALNEGVGSIQFSGQGVNFGSTVEVNGKEVSFDTPFKGIKELGNSLAQAFGAEDPINLFSEITAGDDGIEASYDVETNKITLKFSDEFIAECKGRTFDINLKMTFDEYTWTLKNVKLKFSE
ncbi:leucine-rich repeat domain-containing protein [Parvimonas micra]|uniref:leucine-rich repeat domain-containing protein n=1 Tax=Parvimonas micra TaxID=33033 RepID=UPI0022B65414|nr:leucine-rich repeat domain-containing protein [Parvimonas micra]MCZ7409348.1 leucine-rich repeat domain-containing protein [Parvimonas micra]